MDDVAEAAEVGRDWDWWDCRSHVLDHLIHPAEPIPAAGEQWEMRGRDVLDCLAHPAPGLARCARLGGFDGHDEMADLRRDRRRGDMSAGDEDGHL